MASVRVAVRVRPMNKREKDLSAKCIIKMDGAKTSISKPKLVEGAVGDPAREPAKTFTYDFSYDSADSVSSGFVTQEKVFQDLGYDVLKAAFEGYNACIFAYGQTGSGKSYTMMGNPGDAGLIPRICEGLFSRIADAARRDEASFRTEVSYLEIYNERVRDLLRRKSTQTYNLKVREHPKDGPYVEDLSKHLVQNYSEVEELMEAGNIKRTTASTGMNDVSSRSHAIFTVNFTQAKFDAEMPSETLSKIHLVDLAGSERAHAAGTTGARLKEGANINKSLVTLGNVISALADLCGDVGAKKKSVYVPYRDSVLTWLLKDSLGGNSKTIMIATVSPADVNYGETLSTLRYANRAKNIVNRPTVNEDANVRLIRQLRAEIARLKALLLRGDLMAPLDSPTALSMEEKLHRNEARVLELTQEWTNKWNETQSILKEETLALRKEGIGVVLDSELPHLIGIDDDLLSTGIILYHLKEGATHVGREDAPAQQDIVVHGAEVESEHCVFENRSGTVTLAPLGAALCSVNGTRVAQPTLLNQGAVILLGRTNMFRFNHPKEAAKLREKRKSGLLSTFSLSKSCDNLSAAMLCNPGMELGRQQREELDKLVLAREEMEATRQSQAAELQRLHQEVEEARRRILQQEESLRRRRRDFLDEKRRFQEEARSYLRSQGRDDADGPNEPMETCGDPELAELEVERCEPETTLTNEEGLPQDHPNPPGPDRLLYQVEKELKAGGAGWHLREIRAAPQEEVREAQSEKRQGEATELATDQRCHDASRPNWPGQRPRTSLEWEPLAWECAEEAQSSVTPEIREQGEENIESGADDKRLNLDPPVPLSDHSINTYIEEEVQRRLRRINLDEAGSGTDLSLSCQRPEEENPDRRRSTEEEQQLPNQKEPQKSKQLKSPGVLAPSVFPSWLNKSTQWWVRARRASAARPTAAGVVENQTTDDLSPSCDAPLNCQRSATSSPGRKERPGADGDSGLLAGTLLAAYRSVPDIKDLVVHYLGRTSEELLAPLSLAGKQTQQEPPEEPSDRSSKQAAKGAPSQEGAVQSVTGPPEERRRQGFNETFEQQQDEVSPQTTEPKYGMKEALESVKVERSVEPAGKEQLRQLSKEQSTQPQKPPSTSKVPREESQKKRSLETWREALEPASKGADFQEDVLSHTKVILWKVTDGDGLPPPVRRCLSDASASAAMSTRPHVFRQHLVPMPPALERLHSATRRRMLETLESVAPPSLVGSPLAAFWLRVATPDEPRPHAACLLLSAKRLSVIVAGAPARRKDPAFGEEHVFEEETASEEGPTSTESSLASIDTLVVSQHLDLRRITKVQVGLAGQHICLQGGTQGDLLAVFTLSKDLSQDLCRCLIKAISPQSLERLRDQPLLYGDLMLLSLDWSAKVPDVLLDNLTLTSSFKRALADLLYLVHGNMSTPYMPFLGAVQPLLYTSASHAGAILRLLLTDTHVVLLREELPLGSLQPELRVVEPRRRQDVEYVLLRRSGAGPLVLVLFRCGRKERDPGGQEGSTHQQRTWKLHLGSVSEAAALVGQLRA